MVCEKCGIKIPIHSYNQVVEDIADRINGVLHNPKTIEQLSVGTIECAKKFMWSNRIALYNKIYDEISKKYQI